MMNGHFMKGIRSAGFAVAAGASLLLCAGAASAYTLVTRDGHLIESTQKPEVRGTQVFVRLAPTNRLAVIQESVIDWERTQAANPQPQRLVIPADSQMAGERQPAGTIRKTIVGEAGKRHDTPAAQGAPAPTAPAAGSGPAQQNVRNQEAIAALRKQHTVVTGLLASAREQLGSHEKELAELQARPSAFVADDNPVSRRVRELQDQVAEDRRRVGELEARLAGLKNEAVQLGGTID